LKFQKTLGLTYRYKDGRLMPVDDPKLTPIFELCAKHNKPVMIHTADPAAFFTPLDKNNERWHELNEHPNWLFYGEKFGEELLGQFIRVVERHPQTIFIGAVGTMLKICRPLASGSTSIPICISIWTHAYRSWDASPTQPASFF
jgi:hypothetical protein